MFKIAVITHYPRFVHYIETIQRNCPNDEILVYLGENESSIPNLLTKAENDGCTAIITGAFTYNLIASRTSLPIIVNGKPHTWSKKSAALAGGEC